MTMRRCFFSLFFVCASLLGLFLPIQNINADDQFSEEPIDLPSVFFGEEVPLNFDGVSTFSKDVNGYNVSMWYRSSWDTSGSWTSFTGYASLEKNALYDFYFLVYPPEIVEKNTVFNLSLVFSVEGLSLPFGEDAAICDFYRLNASNYYTSSNILGEKVNSSTYRYNTTSDITASYATDRFNFFIKQCYVNDSFVYISPTAIEINETSEQGLLNGILGGIKNLFNAVIDLPKNIASKLLEGLGNLMNTLFVPSADDISAMWEDWDTLLSDRFGALYQVFDVIVDYCNSFTNNHTEYIDFPSITLNFGNTPFIFGGWRVPVTVDGFSFLFDSIKMIISVLCSLSFINAISNRFNKLLGGSSNI